MEILETFVILNPDICPFCRIKCNSFHVICLLNGKVVHNPNTQLYELYTNKPHDWFITIVRDKHSFYWMWKTFIILRNIPVTINFK